MAATQVPQIAIIADSDGVLVQPGKHDVSKDVSRLFRFTPVVAFVATGRSLNWGWTIGEQIGARGVFAENSARYQFGRSVNFTYSLEEERCVVDPAHIQCLAKLIQLGRDEGGSIATIQINGTRGRVFVHPDKKATLTLGTRASDGSKVSGCPWISEQLKDKLTKLIEMQGLEIGCIGPFSDGNLDFQPQKDGRLVDKSWIPPIVQERFPSARPVALVDGINDVSLARHPLVYPITFANGCKEVKEAVRERGGLIIPKVGHEGGCLEALYYIRREFLGITQSSKWDQERGWMKI